MSRVFTYDEAYEDSLAYFNNNDLAARIVVDKYLLRDNDKNLLESNPDQMHWRHAREFARIEANKFKQPYSAEFIYSYFRKFNKIILQGSPLYGIGNPYQYVTLSNCYVLTSPLDSYGGIHATDEELSHISKRRGGCGIDVSYIRPRGSATHNSSRTSTGIIPFMERYSNSIREVGQDGRRGALMITVSVHHPEVLEFARVKNDEKSVTGANISVRLTDEFLQAVKDDTEYEQRWPVDSNAPKISIKVKAKDIWDALIHNAWLRAEPGLLFWDRILKESPADCYSHLGFNSVTTNPCSELPLCELDSCRLMIINLNSYVKNRFTSNTYFDYDELYNDALVLQRLMDDTIDLEIEAIDKILDKIYSDPEPESLREREIDLWIKIKAKCNNGRRTGSGTLGLGDTLAALGIKYGSDEAIRTAEQIYKTIKLGCYRSSVTMAKEIGPFPIWDKRMEVNNPFLLRIKEEDAKLYNDMQKYGRRNISLLTQAPTGTIAEIAGDGTEVPDYGSSSGIEPVLFLQRTRRKKGNLTDENFRCDFIDGVGDKWMHFTQFHPRLKSWMRETANDDITQSPWYGSCAEDINWKSRVALQAAAQKHIDHSISSTVNLPNNVAEEEVSEIYRKAWETGCKGITVYRDGCRSGVIIKHEEDTNRSAKKRPKQLQCDIFHTTVRTSPYFVVIGTIDKVPYEIFAGLNWPHKNYINKDDKSGILTRIKRGHYTLTANNTNIDNLLDLDNDTEEALTRMVSIGLRHNVPLKYIVQQLDKVEGDMFSLAKAMARTLKKYIKDGETVSGEECLSCGGNLIRAEGCVQCVSCGWSKC